MPQQQVPDGKIVAVTGASGSGKTAWLKRKIVQYDRQLIWDPQFQYDEGRIVVTDKEGLLRAIQKPTIKITYQPSDVDDFGFWAECAFIFAQVGAGLGKMTCIVAEEIADVTNPGKAPKEWGVLVRRVRAFGGVVFAITQSPSESDKTVFRNAMEIHCCALGNPPDRKRMAVYLDLPLSDIVGINRGKLGFIHKDMLSQKVTKGYLKF